LRLTSGTSIAFLCSPSVISSAAASTSKEACLGFITTLALKTKE
jgi:hypothetical protein